KPPKSPKTYNTRYSLVVTDPTTNPALTGLSMGERTGSRVLQWVWSYVTDVAQMFHHVVSILPVIVGREVYSPDQERLPTRVLSNPTPRSQERNGSRAPGPQHRWRGGERRTESSTSCQSRSNCAQQPRSSATAWTEPGSLPNLSDPLIEQEDNSLGVKKPAPTPKSQ
ncbi:hypothetical protein LZ30DRAFT_600699, partial [Colletotrichum cereale]